MRVTARERESHTSNQFAVVARSCLAILAVRMYVGIRKAVGLTLQRASGTVLLLDYFTTSKKNKKTKQAVVKHTSKDNDATSLGM